MKNFLLMCSLPAILVACNPINPDFRDYPSVEISNEEVRMKVYLPDPENGLYRATRFDWAGVIGSVRYREHEYFGYWKSSHDPLFHEDLMGPVEGYIDPGPGYSNGDPGEGFIRIGVGILEKADETAYNWRKTYPILDHGIWSMEQGKDWISFTHELNSDFGYAYRYTKAIQLTDNGFILEHTLENRGARIIETDQFNHNFFRIDGERSGKAFTIGFPFSLVSDSDMKGFLEIRENELAFISDLQEEDSVFVVLEGYSKDAGDHQVTVINHVSGAGVTYEVDQPLHRLVFWACNTTLSPENSVWISVDPGETMQWASEYTLFTLQDSF